MSGSVYGLARTKEKMKTRSRCVTFANQSYKTTKLIWRVSWSDRDNTEKLYDLISVSRLALPLVHVSRRADLSTLTSSGAEDVARAR